MKKLILMIIALILAIIAVSCKSTKLTTSIIEKVRIDTVRDIRTVEKFRAVHDTLTIDNPCDSAGILTTFYSKIRLPQGQVIIRSVRGKIQATVNIDSIVQVYESKYRSKKDTNVTNISKIVTKTVYPAWLIVTVIFETLIILGYIYLRITSFIK